MPVLTPRLVRPANQVMRTVIGQRGVVVAIVRAELEKRYSGSLLGMTWIVLYPALLLSVYLFIYKVVFKTRFPGYSEWDYVLYVFCGLIPYLGFAEALTSGSGSLKQNMHLLKNAMLPIELIPVRSVAVSMVSQVVSLGVLLLLLGARGEIGFSLTLLPIVVLGQFLLLLGLVFILSCVLLILPDLAQILNLIVLLTMFVSPIGYRLDMVPIGYQWVVTANPVSYLIDAYRAALLPAQGISTMSLGIYGMMCVLGFIGGAAFFMRFKDALVDLE